MVAKAKPAVSSKSGKLSVAPKLSTVPTGELVNAPAGKPVEAEQPNATHQETSKERRTRKGAHPHGFQYR